METKGFKFKHFSINQDHCAMKVGTDGVLLGAWCDVSGAGRVLDVGAGCGLIALMVAQRNVSALVEAVEIDGDSVLDAVYNFRESPWANRLSVINSDFLNFCPLFKFDLIVSNPPFFDSGNAAPNKRRAAARHTHSLPFSDFFMHSAALLSANGRIAMVAPAEVKDKIEFLAGESNLWIHRRTSVRTTPLKPVKRLLWEFVNYQTAIVEEELIIQNIDGSRTDAYSNLTAEFYL